jgi:predicted PilT family ATPase
MKDFKKLKHLAIKGCFPKVNFNSFKSLNSQLFWFKNANIDHLIELNLTLLFVSFVINDNILRKLAQMKDLRKIYLKYDSITNSEVIDFMRNSPKMHEIHFNEKFINETTIKAITEKAVNDPKIEYKLMAYGSHRTTPLREIIICNYN